MFIRSFQKHFITPNVDKKALSKLSSAVYTAIRSNSISSLEEFEKFCIALLGCENDAARETAVRLLHGIYDGHDWQRLEPFEPVIRNVGDSFVVEIDSSVKQAEKKKKNKNKNKNKTQTNKKQNKTKGSRLYVCSIGLASSLSCSSNWKWQSCFLFRQAKNCSITSKQRFFLGEKKSTIQVFSFPSRS